MNRKKKRVLETETITYSGVSIELDIVDAGRFPVTFFEWGISCAFRPTDLSLERSYSEDEGPGDFVHIACN